MPNRAPERAVGRLCLYRRLLSNLLADGADFVYSHQLARAAGVTAAQVRRDVMLVGSPGTPSKGYDIRRLTEVIGEFLDAPAARSVALVGVGNLGRAILSYFRGRRPNLAITAAFDIDPELAGRVINGCRCYAMAELPRIAAEQRIRVGIVAVPAGQAQAVADAMAAAGVRGVMNFAPTRLRLPASIYVEDMDLTTSLEKVAFFAARQDRTEDGAR